MSSALFISNGFFKQCCSKPLVPPPPPSLPSPRTLERGTVPIHQNHQQARSTFLAAPSPMVFVDARSLPVDGQRVGLRREPVTLQADRVIGFRSCTDDVSRRDGYLSPPHPTPAAASDQARTSRVSWLNALGPVCRAGWLRGWFQAFQIVANSKQAEDSQIPSPGGDSCLSLGGT